MFLTEHLQRKHEAEKQQIFMENKDEKSAYQKLLRAFNQLEQKNDALEEQLRRHKGGNAHKVRKSTVCCVLTPEPRSMV